MMKSVYILDFDCPFIYSDYEDTGWNDTNNGREALKAEILSKQDILMTHFNKDSELSLYDSFEEWVDEIIDTYAIFYEYPIID